MNKFDALYNKIIFEAAGRLSGQLKLIKDIIENDFIAEGFVFKEDWKDYLPKLEEYILNQIKDSNKYDNIKKLKDLDESDLTDLVKDAFDNYNLVIEINDDEE